MISFPLKKSRIFEDSGLLLCLEHPPMYPLILLGGKNVLDGLSHERSTVDIFSPDGFAAPTAHRRSSHTSFYIIAWLERSYMVLMT